MNVATIGIQGYEYQYKVTLLIYLIYHSDNLQLFVEKVGNEDALLLIENQNIKIRIQIQVKHEKGSLDIVKLVDWLSHFEERSDDASLLQRLIDKKDDIVLFVTRSRCADETLFLKSEMDRLNVHNDLKLSKEKKQRLITALEKITHGTSKLNQAREFFDFQLAQLLKQDNALEDLLTRVVVWEEFSDSKVDSIIVNTLTSRHQIANSMANIVYLELLEGIKEGRNQQHDIQSALHAIIQTRKIGRPITETNYFERGDETNLLNIAQNSKVLLLTGLTLCGKSEVAKVIAANLVDQGFDYHHTSDVKDLRSFLATNLSDHKVAILEDPWGHLNLVPGYDGIQREVEKIVRNLQQHHIVIVTTSLQLLLELNQTNHLHDCNILGNVWIDLTERDPSRADAYWCAIASHAGTDDSVKNLVSKNLVESNGDHLLQIGQLRFLASYEEAELRNRSFHELEHIARRNSREIADWIYGKDPYYSEVLAVLAMVSTSIINVNKSDLAFIFSSDTSRPSFIDKDKSSIYLEDEDREFPHYKPLPVIDPRTSTSLEFFEERQLIKVSGDELQFSHPNYYEAGRFAFFTKTQSRQQRLLEYLMRAVTCPSPDNAYLAAKKFQFIYSGLRKDLKPKLIDIGFSSINSVFPAVEDTAIVFLSNNMRDIHEELLDKLIAVIQRGGTSSDSISFHKRTIPFISYDRSISKLFFVPNDASVKRAEELLTAKTLPSVQDGWELLESWKDGRDVPAYYFEVLLSYRETFIRKRVVLQFFRRLNESSFYLLEEIFNDEHPSVVFSAIRGALLFWKNFSSAVKSLLMAYITKAMSKEQVAIRASSLISTFAAHYGSEGIYTLDEIDEKDKKEIWNVWGEIYPIMSKNLPSDGVFLNTARFGSTMDQATRYLDKETGMKVFTAWFDRINDQIVSGRTLDEFEMSIAANLLEFTKDDFESRRNLLPKLLTHVDTSFMISSLKWTIQYWDELHESEQNIILTLIDSGREDVRWIKAVLLASEKPPRTIVLKILGEEDVLQKDIAYVLSKFPPDLLQDCLNVFCGFPQPLWWLAVHHKNIDFWNKVIVHILLNNFPYGYEIALQQFVNDGVNSFSKDWEDPEELWKAICSSAKEKRTLLESLIYNTGSCSCSLPDTTMLWRVLMHSYSSTDKEEELLDIIVDNIEMLQQTGHKDDLIRILGKDFINQKLIKKIQPDSLLITMLSTFERRLFSADEGAQIVHLLSSTLKKLDIRFYLTFRYFNLLQDKAVLPEEIKVLMNAFPNRIDEMGKVKIEEWDKRFEYRLKNWTA